MIITRHCQVLTHLRGVLEVDCIHSSSSAFYTTILMHTRLLRVEHNKFCLLLIVAGLITRSM